MSPRDGGDAWCPAFSRRQEKAPAVSQIEGPGCHARSCVTAHVALWTCGGRQVGLEFYLRPPDVSAQRSADGTAPQNESDHIKRAVLPTRLGWMRFLLLLIIALTHLYTMSVPQVSRRVVQKVFAAEQSDGVGVRLRRAIGNRQLRNLTPFLMLDHFTITPGSGFADHPHRGQTTVTYMFDGFVEHEDFAGHRGVIGPGDIQWMCVGRGMVHAEMPKHKDDNGNPLPNPVGMQLWLDLPKSAKYVEPSYQELRSAEMPHQHPRDTEPAETEGKGWEIKIIAGRSHGGESPVKWPQGAGCWFMDIKLDPQGWVFQELPNGWNTILYLVGGTVTVGDKDAEYNQYDTLVLTTPSDVNGQDGVRITNPTDKPARVILISGEPMKDRVVQYGPFVLNSEEEVYKAIEDYQLGKNGFERAPHWQSEIAKGFR
ncbi:RNA pol II transcription cofactor [Malassezia pachydermatis]